MNAPDEDWLEEVISDTIDMDWQPRWAAQAIVRRWGECNDQTAWLVEMIHNDAPVPRYWNGSKFKEGWVWDANEAMRFCRECDARDFLDGLRMTLQGKPVEHVFLAGPLKATGQ